MRILVLTDGFPFPLSSGRLREHHFLRQLSARHEVLLLSAVQPRHPREHLAALRPWVSHIDVVETSRLAPDIARRVYGRVRAMALTGRTHPMRELMSRAADLHAFEPLDVVLNAHLRAPVGETLPSVPHVVDLCDAMTFAARGRLRHASPSDLPAAAMTLLEASRKERALVRAADRLILASERDARALFPSGAPDSLPVDVVPNGVDLEYWQRSTGRLGSGLVVFSGAMAYPPNEDAALRLIEHVMPAVRRRLPRARLAIAGRDPTPRLRGAAAGRPWLEVTGYVPDVRPYLERASVFAAPLRFGAGIQNKVLEALAMALPVVASPGAAVGLVRGGERPPLVVADGDDAMASALVDMIEAADRDPTPHDLARRWVTDRFDWGRIGERLEQILVEAVRTGPRAGR